MKDRVFFTSYDVWEYITQCKDEPTSTAGLIYRFIDLRRYADKFAGYITAPVVIDNGSQYIAKQITLFDHACLDIFLKSMRQKSIVLYSAVAVYELVSTELDQTTFESIEVDEPYLKKYIQFRYAEC